MTDYSLCEVILNGNKVLKRTVRETEQEYEPTTTEEKQDRRNEMKARGTLLMALPNKDQLKFHSYKDAKLLMEAIAKSTNSTNEADNTAYGVSAAHTQSNPSSGDNLSLKWSATIVIKIVTLQENVELLEIKKTGKENSRRTMTVETPTKNGFELSDGIGGQVCDKFKTGLGYNAASPTVESFVNSSEMLENQEYNKSKSDKGYHAVPPPYTGNFIPSKPDLTHMTRNKCYLTEYEDYDGGFVSFGDGKGRIFGIGKIKTGTLYFDNVYFYKELKYNLFSVSQICDKKNNVLSLTLNVLSYLLNFKLLNESQVLLRVPRKDNIYSVESKEFCSH
ncbi:hypothetical protein Tco_0087135 [Tanacetum coccineum]